MTNPNEQTHLVQGHISQDRNRYSLTHHPDPTSTIPTPLKMSYPIKLTNLTTREAIADAIHRATTAYDHNDYDMLASAFTTDATFGVDGHAITGLENIKTQNFDRVGKLDTLHLITNIRIEVESDAATTASATANGLAQHYATGEGLDAANTRRLLAGVEYFVDLVKVEDEGLWKISKMIIKTHWREGDPSVMGF